MNDLAGFPHKSSRPLMRGATRVVTTYDVAGLFEPAPWFWPTTEDMRQHCVRVFWDIDDRSYINDLHLLRQYMDKIAERYRYFEIVSNRNLEKSKARVAVADLIEQFKRNSRLPHHLLDEVHLNLEIEGEHMVRIPKKLYADETMLGALKTHMGK